MKERASPGIGPKIFVSPGNSPKHDPATMAVKIEKSI